MLIFLNFRKKFIFNLQHTSDVIVVIKRLYSLSATDDSLATADSSLPSIVQIVNRCGRS